MLPLRIWLRHTKTVNLYINSFLIFWLFGFLVWICSSCANMGYSEFQQSWLALSECGVNNVYVFLFSANSVARASSVRPPCPPICSSTAIHGHIPANIVASGFTKNRTWRSTRTYIPVSWIFGEIKASPWGEYPTIPRQMCQNVVQTEPPLSTHTDPYRLSICLIAVKLPPPLGHN